jgi:hypothetical protein
MMVSGQPGGGCAKGGDGMGWMGTAQDERALAKGFAESAGPAGSRSGIKIKGLISAIVASAGEGWKCDGAAVGDMGNQRIQDRIGSTVKMAKGLQGGMNHNGLSPAKSQIVQYAGKIPACYNSTVGIRFCRFHESLP